MSSIYTTAVRSVGRSVKQFLPDEIRHHKVVFGLCRGNYLPMNLRRNVRVLFGLYELEIARYVRDFAQPGSCCFDVGANTGYYTLALARLADPGRVYAFETERNLCAQLRQTLALNAELAPRVDVRNIALAQETDEGLNRVTLDDLVFRQGVTAPDFIKMDIDGPEHKVLLGGTRVLRECRPRLVVEVHSPELETNCKDLLENAGYLVRIIKNYRFFTEYRPLELNRWLSAERH
jgi:precorrin-6B methylase 2